MNKKVSRGDKIRRAHKLEQITWAEHVAKGTMGGGPNLWNWVVHYARQLRMQGDWGRFEELTIRTTEFSSDVCPTGLNTAEKRVLRDELGAWC